MQVDNPFYIGKQKILKLSMYVFNWAALISVLIYEVNAVTRSSCQQTARFEKPKKGYTLDGNIFATVNVKNAVNCVVNCLQHPNCQSINFHASANPDHVCELNSKTGHDVTLTAKSDVLYYGPTKPLEPNCAIDGPGECENGGQCVMSCSRDQKLMCQCPANRAGLTCRDEAVPNKNQGFTMVFPTRSNENGITVDVDAPEMANITILFWISTTNKAMMTVVDYTATETEGEFRIMVEHEKLKVVLQDADHLLKFIIPPINDGYWHHVGVTWSLGNYAVYLDGNKVYNGSDFGSAVPLKAGRVFHIGRKYRLGAFDEENTLDGKLSQLNIWDEILTAEKIKWTSKSCYNYVGTIVDWSTVVGKTSGAVYKEQYSCRALRQNDEYDITMSANSSQSAQATHIVSSDNIPSLDAVTITLWGKHSEYLRYVQYANNAGETLLSFRLHKDVLILEITGADSALRTKQARVPMYWKESPAYWHHIATTWSSATGKWKIYLDGSLVSIMHGVASGITIPAGGELSLGLGNPDNGDVSMDGSLSRLNIWDYEVAGLAISLMANKGPLFENGNVFAWYGVKSKSVGDMNFQETPSDLYNSRSGTAFLMKFPAASTSNYALLYNAFPNEITKFSACFWALFQKYSAGIFTYSSPNYDDEFATYLYSDYYFDFLFRGSRAYAGSIIPGNRWNFYCVQWRSSDGLIEFYRDAWKLTTSTKGAGKVLPAGGAMVLGQELDAYAGGFSSSQAMQGFLVGLNFWTDFLTANEVQGMAVGHTNINGNLLQWRDLRTRTFGAVNIDPVNPVELPEYRVQKLRDDYCENRYTGTYARFVLNQDLTYKAWRCIRPAAMLAENMCYGSSSGTGWYYSKSTAILSFT